MCPVPCATQLTHTHTTGGGGARFSRCSSPLFHAYDGKAAAVFVDSECKVLDRVRSVRLGCPGLNLSVDIRDLSTTHRTHTPAPTHTYTLTINRQGQPRARPGAAARQLLLGQQRARQQLGHGLRHLASGAGEGGGALPLRCVRIPPSVDQIDPPARIHLQTYKPTK